MRTILAKVSGICKVALYETIEEANNSKILKFFDRIISHLFNIIVILSVIRFILTLVLNFNLIK